jgi:anion-transporting  ArsA/GET3 family ATPase
LTKVLGGQMLSDVQTFVAALDTMFGGFRKRADHTYALLSDRSTTFIVVAAPERDALREASFFVDRLDEEAMPLAGLVINRMYRVCAPGLSAARALGAAEELGEREDETSAGTGSSELSEHTAITQGLLRMHAVQAEIAARHESLAKRFIAGHPDIPTAEVPAASGDIHDLLGLRAVGEALAGH